MFSFASSPGGLQDRGSLRARPFYYWWCYWGCAPGSVITDKQSTIEFGYNLGAAVTFELANDSVIYLEVKYHWVDTKVTSKFLPITIGYRW